MRNHWLELMLKIAEPVITNLAEGKLHKTIPLSFHNERKDYCMLESFGRTALGLAPWLGSEEIGGEEKALQEKYRMLISKAVDNATNPGSPDCMNFSKGGQPLVDAAFLAHAVVLAPEVMFYALEDSVKRNFTAALKKTREIKPPPCNWLLFSAMIEAALYVMGDEDYDLAPVDHAVDSFKQWYVGDGTYSDGEFFHWDYYNSIVIHPMLMDILRVFSDIRPDFKEFYTTEEKRASRFAGILEQLIAPDGTYPIFGRSSVYRFGAFHALSHAVLKEYLPENLSYGQARCALDAVIRKVSEKEDMFDENGWLLPGVYGLQPDMAEDYICTGSLYLCQAVFLPLGLPETHKFWSEANQKYTSQKIWSGENVKRDHASD